ncbi:MAG: hypothetical protein WA705_22495 [Candidatus Ozemobacteraceae bacterium]
MEATAVAAHYGDSLVVSMDAAMSNSRQLFRGITLVEILLGFLLLALVFLPIFQKLTNAVKDTERFYTECFALSQAKMVMDSLMVLTPFRCIHEGNPCLLADRKNVPAIQSLLAQVVPDLFQSEYSSGAANEYLGNGLLADQKGFRYRIRVKCIDLEDIVFGVTGKSFTAHDLSEKDADGKWTLMKKLIVEVRWSLNKGMDPINDSNSRSLFLVGIKSDLER